eukprot:913028_1
MAELEKSVHDKIADRSWIDAQRNTFTKWANDILSPRTSHISDLSGDLFDGIVLIDLLEELSGRSVPHARRVRAMSVNMRRNRASQFSICGDTLRFIRDEGINIVNVNIGDILDGNIRIILGLIWQLILHYRISVTCVEEAVCDPWVHSAQQSMLNWVRETVGPDGDRISNFKTSWSDGMALWRLISAMCPSALSHINAEILTPIRRVELAMEAAENILGIPKVLDPADMCNSTDDLSIITYIQYFMNHNNPNRRSSLSNMISVNPEDTPKVVKKSKSHSMGELMETGMSGESYSGDHGGDSEEVGRSGLNFGNPSDRSDTSVEEEENGLAISAESMRNQHILVSEGHEKRDEILSSPSLNSNVTMRFGGCLSETTSGEISEACNPGNIGVITAQSGKLRDISAWYDRTSDSPQIESMLGEEGVEYTVVSEPAPYQFGKNKSEIFSVNRGGYPRMVDKSVQGVGGGDSDSICEASVDSTAKVQEMSETYPDESRETSGEISQIVSISEDTETDEFPASGEITTDGKVSKGGEIYTDSKQIGEMSDREITAECEISDNEIHVITLESPPCQVTAVSSESTEDSNSGSRNSLNETDHVESSNNDQPSPMKQINSNRSISVRQLATQNRLRPWRDPPTSQNSPQSRSRSVTKGFKSNDQEKRMATTKSASASCSPTTKFPLR